jgi:hypothetical protein
MFSGMLGYYVKAPKEAYAEVGAYLVELPKDDNFRKVFFETFSNTWPVVLLQLEQKKVATVDTVLRQLLKPEKAAAEGQLEQKKVGVESMPQPAPVTPPGSVAKPPSMPGQ